MSAPKYFVDWSDPAGPKILPIKFALEETTPLGLWEAKKQVIDHHQTVIDRAREEIRSVRELRAEDIVVG